MEKSMRISGIFASVALVAGVAFTALADDDSASCGNAPRAQWMTEDAAKSKAAELGYDVRRVKKENGCYEIYAVDKSGAKIELKMHPVTGALFKSNGES